MPVWLDRRQTILLGLLDKERFQRASELLTKTTVFNSSTGIALAMGQLVAKGLAERKVEYKNRNAYGTWRLAQKEDTKE